MNHSSPSLRCALFLLCPLFLLICKGRAAVQIKQDGGGDVEGMSKKGSFWLRAKSFIIQTYLVLFIHRFLSPEVSNPQIFRLYTCLLGPWSLPTTISFWIEILVLTSLPPPHASPNSVPIPAPYPHLSSSSLTKCHHIQTYSQAPPASLVMQKSPFSAKFVYSYKDQIYCLSLSVLPSLRQSYPPQLESNTIIPAGFIGVIWVTKLFSNVQSY